MSSVKKCLILGGGNIGLALGRQIKKKLPEAAVVVTKRSIEDVPKEQKEELTFLPHDPLKEGSWSSLAQTLENDFSELDLVISTYGVLHNDTLAPEKKLEDIKLSNLVEAFSVNTFTAPLAAKYLMKIVSKGSPSTFVFLSAKVGSIADDSTGGWYAYRSSKAALNMMVKNMAIEFKNRNKKTFAVAIHPGTTETHLSKPFLSGFSLKVWSPDETAEHILNVISEIGPEKSGSFLNWDGSTIPW